MYFWKNICLYNTTLVDLMAYTLLENLLEFDSQDNLLNSHSKFQENKKEISQQFTFQIILNQVHKSLSKLQ
jgi:hypothetical protein